MAEQVTQDKTPDIDPRVYHPLGRLRLFIRCYVLVEGILLALILACAWFWCITGVDLAIHYFADVDLLEKAGAVRIVFMVLLAFGLGGVFLWYIARRLFRDLFANELALVLEKRFPKILGDRLITAIELKNLKRAEKQGYSVAMIQKTMKDASERVRDVPVLSVFNWRRLVNLTWLLVVVSAGILLLTYPISILGSLKDRPIGRTFWALLIIHSLIILCFLFVMLTPWILGSFRQAGRAARWGLLGMAILAAGGVAAGYVISEQQINPVKQSEFSWQLYHVGDISMKRNLLFTDTRWPKDEYFLEWIDFPVAEKRIRVAQTLGATAYFNSWIVADDKAPKQWRPLLYKDLAKRVDAKDIPELPLEQIHAYILTRLKGSGGEVGYDKTKVILPNADDVSLDLVLAVVEDSADNPAAAEEIKRWANVTGILLRQAADPKQGGREIRYVAPPAQLDFVAQNDAGGIVAKDEMVLGSGPSRNRYQLKSEKIAFKEPATAVVEGNVRGRSLRTDPRTISMVLDPRVSQLVSQEFCPAYHYYLPPTAPRVDSLDERRNLLRGLRQALRPKTESFPKESQSFTIAQGSEFVLKLASDKKLEQVTITARTSTNEKGVAGEKNPTIPVTLDADRKVATIAFRQDGQSFREWKAPPEGAPPESAEVSKFAMIDRLTTFDIVLKDTDNMTTRLTYTIRPTEDKPPELKMFVDVIRTVDVNGRKVFMCTPVADIPFKVESLVTDDIGLHKLEYVFDYVPVANATVTGQRAEFAAWLWASSPVMPNIGDFLYRREILLRTVMNSKGPEPVKGSIRVTAFDTEQGRVNEGGLLKLEQLNAKLQEPLAAGYVSPLLRNFAFKEEDRPLGFDLRKLIPRLGEPDPITKGVATYDLRLNVRATDANVQTAESRSEMSDSNLPLFRLVPEDVLHPYISRDESEQAAVLDKLITSLEASQRILQGTMSRVPALSPTTATQEQTLFLGVVEAVSRAKTDTVGVSEKYDKIVREYRLNRFPNQLTNGLDEKILDPLRSILTKEFKIAEDDLTRFQDNLKEGRPELMTPDVPLVQLHYQQLLEALKRIRGNMTDSATLNKAIVRFRAVIAGQEELTKEDIIRLEREIQDRLLNIKVILPEFVSVTKGQSTKVNVKLRMPDSLITDPYLRFELPKDGSLKVTPVEIKLKDESTEASFEISAAGMPGTYFLKILPVPGKPIELKVIVK